MRTRPVKQFYLERLHRQWKQAQFERTASEQESRELYERLLEHLEVFYHGGGGDSGDCGSTSNPTTVKGNLAEINQLDHSHKQTLMELIRTVRQNPTLLTEELPLKVIQDNSDRLLTWMARLFPSSKGSVDEVFHSMVGRMMMGMTNSSNASKGNAKNQAYRLMEFYLREGTQQGRSWYADHLTPRLEPVIREILFAPTMDAHKASPAEQEQFVVWVVEALAEAAAHMPSAMTRIFRSLLVEEGQDVDEIVIDDDDSHLMEAIRQPRPCSMVIQFFWWKVIGGLFQQPTVSDRFKCEVYADDIRRSTTCSDKCLNWIPSATRD